MPSQDPERCYSFISFYVLQLDLSYEVFPAAYSVHRAQIYVTSVTKV